MKQIDIFGNEIDIVKVPILKKGRPKFPTMQEIYGMNLNHKCKECVHCLKLNYHNKTYYKCELWFQSNSEATDIRLKNFACNKFEK